jgi:hypothetical protein
VYIERYVGKRLMKRIVKIPLEYVVKRRELKLRTA